MQSRRKTKNKNNDQKRYLPNAVPGDILEALPAETNLDGVLLLLGEAVSLQLVVEGHHEARNELLVIPAAALLRHVVGLRGDCSWWWLLYGARKVRVKARSGDVDG